LAWERASETSSYQRLISHCIIEEGRPY
jgi:hypothetical protein